MFITLLKKELMDLFKSSRFIVGWLIVLTLMITAVFLLSGDVQQRKESLQLTEHNREKFINDYGHRNRAWYFIQPLRNPERLEVLIRGVDDPEEYSSFFSDPVKMLFPKLDLLYIVTLLLSLLAVIFTYDSVCGEREDGTLKLLHSTRISRANVILAKLTGAWLAIGIPFIGVVIMAAFFGASFGGIELNGEPAMELGLVAIASLLYIGFFLCLGLFVSSLVKHSGTSILVLLFLWVVFTLVIPNVGPILAAQIKPLPSVNSVERELQLLRTINFDKKREEAVRLMRSRLCREHGVPGEDVSLRKDNLLRLGLSEQKIAKLYADYRRQYGEIMQRISSEIGIKARSLENEMWRKIEAQSDLARQFSLLSPTSSLTYFTTDLASVGLRAEDHFTKHSMEYLRTEYGPYLNKKQKEMEKERGRRVSWDEPYDLSDRPRFEHHSEPFEERLGATLPYLGHVAIFMLIVLLAAVLAYMRYDVR